MQTLAIVFVGGGLGAALRHLVNLGAARLLGVGYPWGTLTVNVVGSFVMGVLVAWLATRFAGPDHHLRLFLATGVLGGFTTFSAFSLDAVALWERGAHGAAAGYVLASVVLSIGGLFAGLALGRGWA
jgi:CrcB protein